MTRGRARHLGLGRLLRQQAGGRATLNDRAWSLNPVAFPLGRFLRRLRKRFIAMRVASIRIAVNAARLQAHTQSGTDAANAQARQAHALSEQGRQIADLSARADTAIADIAVLYREQLDGVRKTQAQLSDLRSRVDRITGAMQQLAEHVIGPLSARAQSVTKASELIEGIALQTQVLSLNAGVEAARAGPVGNSFAVVAAEVGSLARRVDDATQDIAQNSSQILELVGQSEQQSQAIHQDLQVSNQLVRDFCAQYDQLVEHLGGVAGRLDAAAGHVAHVNQTNQSMIAAIREVTDGSGDLLQRMSAMNEEVQHIRGHVEGLQGMLTEWRAGGTGFDYLSDCVARLRERGAALLKAAAATGLDIFSTRYVRIAGSDPARYHVGYDQRVDRALQPVIDAIRDAIPHGAFAILVDRNGYAPTHNSNYARASRGDLAYDTLHCRDKRVFSDPIGLAAARNTGAVLCQTYMRDTGEIMTDVSAPVFIDGRHWGAVRIGLDYLRFEAAFNRQAGAGRRRPARAVAAPAAP